MFLHSFKKATQKKIVKFDLSGQWKEGIGLLQTGRKSYGQMNLLSLSFKSLGGAGYGENWGKNMMKIVLHQQ